MKTLTQEDISALHGRLLLCATSTQQLLFPYLAKQGFKSDEAYWEDESEERVDAPTAQTQDVRAFVSTFNRVQLGETWKLKICGFAAQDKEDHLAFYVILNVAGKDVYSFYGDLNKTLLNTPDLQETRYGTVQDRSAEPQLFADAVMAKIEEEVLPLLNMPVEQLLKNAKRQSILMLVGLAVIVVLPLVLIVLKHTFVK